MSDPVTLIVLVASGEASSPTSVAMTRAVREALGDATVEVQETPRAPTDAEALAVEETWHPDAVVELIWDDADRRKVVLRVHMAQTKRWLERSMVYTTSDPVSERGRTLGLAVASALPEISPRRGTVVLRDAPDVAHSGDAASSPTPDASATTPAGSRSPSLSRSPATAPRPNTRNAAQGRPSESLSIDVSGASESAAEARAPEAEPEPEAATVDLRRPHLEVQLVASGATGIGGSANTAGGGGAAQWFVARWLAVRFGAAERSGGLSDAEATVFTFYGAAGLSVHPWQATRARPFDLSLRVDYLVIRQSATHFDADDPLAVTRARWVSGADAFLDTGWLLSTDVAALAGLGLEDVIAPTYVDVRNTRVATIPPVRVVAELGVRLRF